MVVCLEPRGGVKKKWDRRNAERPGTFLLLNVQIF
jgi:hypothetical protein